MDIQQIGMKCMRKTNRLSRILVTLSALVVLLGATAVLLKLFFPPNPPPWMPYLKGYTISFHKSLIPLGGALYEGPTDFYQLSGSGSSYEALTKVDDAFLSLGCRKEFSRPLTAADKNERILTIKGLGFAPPTSSNIGFYCVYTNGGRGYLVHIFALTSGNSIEILEDVHM